jgi:hypothetical protein
MTELAVSGLTAIARWTREIGGAIRQDDELDDQLGQNVEKTSFRCVGGFGIRQATAVRVKLRCTTQSKNFGLIFNETRQERALPPLLAPALVNPKAQAKLPHAPYHRATEADQSFQQTDLPGVAPAARL